VPAITLPRRPHLHCVALLRVSGFALVSRVLMVLRLIMFLSGAFGIFRSLSSLTKLWESGRHGVFLSDLSPDEINEAIAAGLQGTRQPSLTASAAGRREH